MNFINILVVEVYIARSGQLLGTLGTFDTIIWVFRVLELFWHTFTFICLKVCQKYPEYLICQNVCQKYLGDVSVGFATLLLSHNILPGHSSTGSGSESVFRAVPVLKGVISISMAALIVNRPRYWYRKGFHPGCRFFLENGPFPMGFSTGPQIDTKKPNTPHKPLTVA